MDEPEKRKESRRETISRGLTAFGSSAGALLGLAAVVLSILALSGLLTVPLTAIAVIVVGAALLLESAALAARSTMRENAVPARTAVLGSAGADGFTALAAIILGVLALFDVRPYTLLPIASLALGAGLLFGGASAIIEQIRAVLLREGHEHAEDASTSIAGVHMFVGAGALVLGILGVLGEAPVLLTLIATLSIGASLMLSGAALGARVATTVEQAS